MPIEFPQSKWRRDREPEWQQMRDTYAGQRAVHERDTRGRWSYLPPLEGQDQAQYLMYKMRTPFFGAVEITTEAFVGLVHRKDPTSQTEGLPEEVVEDITLTGLGVEDACKEILFERLLTGFVGVLVDHPASGGQETKATAAAKNLRPHWTIYEAEQIHLVIHERIANRRMLTRVVLEESFDALDSDGKAVERQRKRTLILEGGVYRQEVEEEADGGRVEKYDVAITRAGASLDYIPFFVGPQLKGTKGPQKPPLLNLSDLTLSLYRLRADHYHGLHYAGLPTPYVTGVDPEDKPTTIGCAEIWCLEDPQAKAGVLETAKDFPGHEKEEAAIRSEMAQAGSRVLSPDSNRPEKTKYESNVETMGETSVLLKLVLDASALCTAALREAGLWLALPNQKDLLHEFNKDFLPQALTPTEALALVETWLRGAISRDTLHANLQRGEIMAGDRTLEDEKELIDSDLPPGLGDDDEDDGELGVDTGQQGGGQ